MKKISLLCLLFIVSIVLTNAQETQIQINDPNDEQVSKPDSSPAARARRGSELLQQKLRLDNAQKSKVYDILLQQAKRTDSLVIANRNEEKRQSEEKPKVYFDDSKAKFRTIFDESLTKIDAVLATQKQRKAFNKWKKESFYTIDSEGSLK